MFKQKKNDYDEYENQGISRNDINTMMCKIV